MKDAQMEELRKVFDEYRAAVDARRVMLEDVLLLTLAAFEEETGAEVQTIYVNRELTTPLGRHTPETLLASVTVGLDL